MTRQERLARGIVALLILVTVITIVFMIDPPNTKTEEVKDDSKSKTDVELPKGMPKLFIHQEVDANTDGTYTARTKILTIHKAFFDGDTAWNYREWYHYTKFDQLDHAERILDEERELALTEGVRAVKKKFETEKRFEIESKRAGGLRRTVEVE